MMDYWNGVVCDVHSRIKSWFLYHDDHLAYSKIATFALICITCVGTRNKKHLEFNARKQVLYPLVCGIALLIVAVWLFNLTTDLRLYSLRLNIILYMATSVVGTIFGTRGLGQYIEVPERRIAERPVQLGKREL